VRGAYESLQDRCEHGHSLEQDNLAAFKALAGWGLLMGVLMFAMLYLGLEDLEKDSYERESYGIEQCYPNAGAWPDPPDTCYVSALRPDAEPLCRPDTCPRSDQTGPAGPHTPPGVHRR